MAITFSGFNGIDFSTLIDATITAESGPLNTLKQQQTDIKAKDSALLSLSGGISTMESQAAALNASSLFTNATGSTSDPTVGTATAGDNALNGEYALHVDHLAKAQVTASTTGYAAATNIVATGGSLSFTINGTTTTPINITSDTSLTDLRNAINAQNSGVVASIVSTGSNRKLVISSATTGASGAFTVHDTLTNSSGAALAFDATQSPTHGNAQDAIDASFSINGLDFSSSTNSTSDAIPGIALKLTGVGDATLTVAPDYSNVESSLKSFVTTYNQLRQFAANQNSVSSTTGTRGPLANDPVLREVLDDMRNIILSANSNGGQYSRLSDIGVALDSTGMLQIDDATFQAAMDGNPGDVQKLLQGTDSVEGVFGNFKDRLQQLDGATGFIKTTRDSISSSLDNVASRIKTEQARLDLRKKQLQAEYTAADQAISKLNAMQGQLSQLGTAKLF